MQIILDKWLSALIHRETYRVQPELSDLTCDKEYDFPCQFKKIENVFLYVKLPTTFLELTHFFQKADFRIADVNIVFEKKISHSTSFDSDGIRFSLQTDQKEVQELARKSFKYSRFHMDKAFLPEQANLIKAEWANNFFLGKRGKWMIVAEKNNKIVGFLLILEAAKNVLVIDLIAVDSNFRGQGLAHQMITLAEKELFSFNKIQVGTQIVNYSSMHLYENMGFRICGSYYVLHYHNISKEKKIKGLK